MIPKPRVGGVAPNRRRGAARASQGRHCKPRWLMEEGEVWGRQMGCHDAVFNSTSSIERPPGSRRRFIAFSPTEFECKFHTVVVQTRTPYGSRTWRESTEIVVLTD